MDLMLLGSEINTNSLLQLVTVYIAVSTRLLATWSELRTPTKSRSAGRASCNTNANDKELSGCERFSSGRVQLPARSRGEERGGRLERSRAEEDGRGAERKEKRRRADKRIKRNPKL